MSKCDRCGGQLWMGDERIMRAIAREFPDRHLCTNCVLDAEAAAALGQLATFSNRSLEEYLRRWLARYE